jgi:hypothetical protein
MRRTPKPSLPLYRAREGRGDLPWFSALADDDDGPAERFLMRCQGFFPMACVSEKAF